MAGQTKALESAADPSIPILMRPVGRQILGIAGMVCGALCAFTVIFSDIGAPWYQVWIVASFFGSLISLVSWRFGFRNWLEVTRDGLRVVNPLSEGWIPWSALRGAYGGGVSLDLRGDGWSMGVSAAATSGWERMLRRPSYAERVATALMQRARVVSASGEDVSDNQSGGHKSQMTKRWIRPWPELAASAVFVVILGALSFAANR